MDPREITATITAIANILASRLTKRELAYWGIILTQLGETMGSIAALWDLKKDTTSSTSETSSGIEEATAIQESTDSGNDVRSQLF